MSFQFTEITQDQKHNTCHEWRLLTLTELSVGSVKFLCSTTASFILSVLVISIPTPSCFILSYSRQPHRFISAILSLPPPPSCRSPLFPHSALPAFIYRSLYSLTHSICFVRVLLLLLRESNRVNNCMLGILSFLRKMWNNWTLTVKSRQMSLSSPLLSGQTRVNVNILHIDGNWRVCSGCVIMVIMIVFVCCWTTTFVKSHLKF